MPRTDHPPSQPFPASEELLTRQSFLLLALLAFSGLQAHGQTLGQALNATNLTWTTSGTGGASGWFAESSTTHDGVSAASTGSLTPPQSSTLQTTVTGPGTLTFWWYEPPSGFSTYSFSINGVTQAVYGVNFWQQQTNFLGSGTQTLTWVNLATSFSSATAYLDQVSFTPGSNAPVITTQPFSQSEVPGMNAAFWAQAVGTPPLSYQWQFKGTNLSGATGAVLTVTNVQVTNLGWYGVNITNSAGSVVSSNASLEFGEVTAWNLPGYGRTSGAGLWR